MHQLKLRITHTKHHCRFKSTEPGFTLIEVVLVLAIGGLIFLLAFLAFVQVSINRRDTQRRGDVRQIVALVENFVGDSRQYPCIDAASMYTCIGTATYSRFMNSYILPSNLKNPSGPDYSYFLYPGTDEVSSDWVQSSNTYSPGTIMFSLKATCESGRLVTRVANPPNSYVAWMKLEKGAVCVSNE